MGVAILLAAPWWARLSERAAARLHGARAGRLMGGFMWLWLWWARGLAVICIVGGVLAVVVKVV
jgi:hypothetical protein